MKQKNDDSGDITQKDVLVFTSEEEEEFFGLTTSLFLFKIRRFGRCVLRPSSGGKFMSDC